MTSDFHVNMNEYLPLRDVVFNTLRQAILRGELKPGERLMEIALANRLGVSRTPVREAIRMLELEGLVIMIPRKGAQVAQITEQDLNDVLEVRLGLEELAVQFACERITDEEIDALEAAVQEFENAMGEDDLSQLAEADVKFHEIIYDSTHNRRLVQIINNIREQMYRYRIEYLKDVESRKTLVKEHYAVWAALKNRDVESAKRHISIHIINQQEAIRRSIEEK
ncbi:MAG: GntR family transcriptional regulator [Clostridia bacterium]|nr:GntR family transcriptional regulator [Clostridia bacterium]NCC42276.1 GntR family transcriptional regulator [Clostridia bacterium]